MKPNWIFHLPTYTPQTTYLVVSKNSYKKVGIEPATFGETVCSDDEYISHLLLLLLLLTLL